jgi:hypothetical protein
MLKNIERFNNGENKEGDEARCVPVLIRVGLFELFRPDEWINNNAQQDNSGRQLVG